MERVRGWAALLLAVLSGAACDGSRDDSRSTSSGQAAPPPLLRPAPRLLPLPPDGIRASVRSVYDGDTLTLEDGSKVRLLAVDTPELQAREPLAQEARDFVRGLCQGREVVLEFDVEREDRYARRLCYVYVPEGAEGAMVNAELLRAGLARFYTPGANLKHAPLLLSCQREAREAGRGTWKDYVLARPKSVAVTRSGRAYHRPDCREIAESKNLRTMDEKEALEKGLSRCRTCRP